MIRQNRMLMFLVVASLFIGLTLSVHSQKVPFPDDWEQGAGPEPEEVPGEDERGAVNVAILSDTSPNASSLLDGWEKRHNVEFLNDGWYNNPRSWIPATMPAWAEIDLGQKYEVDKVVFGSEHTAKWNDRAVKEFGILVATVYNADSEAETWEEVFTYEGEHVRDTTPFEFDPIQARWVRIDIRAGESQPRIDEIEIYSMSLSVDARDKLTSTWGALKDIARE